MNIELHVVDRDGVEHVIEVPPEGTLMEVLRELEYGVAALCGGMCSCASCHVYMASRWADRISAAHNDERELVKDLQFRRENSRLSCQIALCSALSGLSVTLAPEE